VNTGLPQPCPANTYNADRNAATCTPCGALFTSKPTATQCYLDAPVYATLGAAAVAALTLPLVPYHIRRSWQMWPRRVDSNTHFFLFFHVLSAVSLLFFTTSGIWGGSCAIFVEQAYGRSPFCQSVVTDALVGITTSQVGFNSILGNLGFILQLWLQAALCYYARKELVYAKSSARVWVAERNRWKAFTLGLAVLALAEFVAIIPQQTEKTQELGWLTASLVGIGLTALVSLGTAAVVVHLAFSIHFTYHALPFLSTRSLAG
jgi:hypothetical protein